MESSPRTTSRASLPSPTQARSAAIIEDGILTGVTGAVVVAVWFLILDMARGRIFFTPSLLGSVVFLGQSPDQVVSVNGFHLGRSSETNQTGMDNRTRGLAGRA